MCLLRRCLAPGGRDGEPDVGLRAGVIPGEGDPSAALCLRILRGAAAAGCAGIARPIDGGMASEALVAHVLVSKFSDQLPFYRQAQIYERHGSRLAHSTLGDWVGRACWWLQPPYERILSHVTAQEKIFADGQPTSPAQSCCQPPKRSHRASRPNRTAEKSAFAGRCCMNQE